jgi:hypothetical protein
MIGSFVDELAKLGAVSDEHAQRSLERLESLNKNRPTLGQVGRYGAIGAVAGPAIGALSNIVEKKPPLGSARAVAAQALKGGLSASAIPLARAHFDRRAELGTLNKYVSEHEKTAKTRAIREWRIAQNSGQEGTADEIARASSQLGLKPRYAEDISSGGMEAGVDKMIGRAMGPAKNESGYIARKLYKPDSPVTTGEETGKLLALKQQYTDTARGLSPEAKGMVPAMYGHKTIEGPAGQLRHVSEHELVPNASSMRRAPDAFAQVSKFQKAVTDPMAERGMPLSDITRVKGNLLKGNFGNVAATPEGPRMIDFLPSGKGTPVSFADTDAVLQTTRGDTSFGRGSLGELRKEVFRPRADYKPGVTPVGKSGVSDAVTSVLRGPDATHVGGVAAPSVYRATARPTAISRAAATVRPTASTPISAIRKSLIPTKVTETASKALGRIPALKALHF